MGVDRKDGGEGRQSEGIREMVDCWGGCSGITLRVMKTRKLLEEARQLAAPFCVANGKKFRLKDFRPGDTQGVKSKSHAEKLLEESSVCASEMQERLYAQDRWALLLIFQGMDAAGKDGAI